jgi:hypothetical protein
VPAGNYNVTLSVDGKTIESKAMKVVMDPAIQMSEAQQKRYFDMAMELHDLQRRGTQMKDALTPLDTQVKDAATKVADSKSVPAAVKTQFTEFEKDLNAIGEKFGVGATGGGGRGGRGGGGGGGGRGGAAAGGRAGGGGAAAAGAGAAAANATAAPVPDPAQAGGAGFGGFGGGAANANETKQYDDVRVALPKAISDANAFLITRATAMSATLKKYDIELKVPAPIK